MAASQHSQAQSWQAEEINHVTEQVLSKQTTKGRIIHIYTIQKSTSQDIVELSQGDNISQASLSLLVFRSIKF